MALQDPTEDTPIASGTQHGWVGTRVVSLILRLSLLLLLWQR